MQHMTNITNLTDVIPTMESIPCPDCGNHVTISPHPNSHFIACMDDCLYHGQCRNISCQNCSKKKKVLKYSDDNIMTFKIEVRYKDAYVSQLARQAI